MELIKQNKKTFFIVFFLTILIGIYLITETLSSKNAPVNNLPVITPSPIIYNSSDLKNDYTRITNKQALSSSDEAAKAKLLTKTQGASGTIIDTTDFRVDYAQAPNSFLVDIKNNDTEKSKQEAVDWFKLQGLSQEGVCNLPVVFYIDSSIRNYLLQNKVQFNPIPNGCQ